jgi:hypothetical protein
MAATVVVVLVDWPALADRLRRRERPPASGAVAPAEVRR